LSEATATGEFGAGEDDVALAMEFAGVGLGGGVFEFDAEAALRRVSCLKRRSILAWTVVFEGFRLSFEVDAGEGSGRGCSWLTEDGYGLTLRMIQFRNRKGAAPFPEGVE